MSSHPEALTLDEHLCYAMYSAHIAINRVYRPVLDRLGITYPQYLVLSALWERDGQTIGSIAERLGLESSTITPLVKRLEIAEFIRRERNPLDERQVIVYMLEKGKLVIKESSCLSSELINKSKFKVEELVKLNEKIRQFRNALMNNQ